LEFITIIPLLKAAISAMKKGLLRNVASLKEDNWIIIIFLYFKKVTQLTNKLISPVAFNTKLVNKK
jgi:hypothetical protein